jgi:hypothetical protein
MEFRLNKIDTDVRQKINDETKEGKVHTKKGISIEKRSYEDRREQKNNKRKPRERFSITKYTSDKKISVEAVKIEKVDVAAEKEENIKQAAEYKGLFIDSRR